MKPAARQLAEPNCSQAEAHPTTVEMKLRMFCRLNATLKGRQCAMA